MCSNGNVSWRISFHRILEDLEGEAINRQGDEQVFYKYDRLGVGFVVFRFSQQ